jgi:dihydroorotate dehydrogenase (fumarate)
MADLTTRYMGLTLRNPIIIGSSLLTSTVDKMVDLEKNGVGAVVLPSLFEEQIRMEIDETLRSADSENLIYSKYSESIDYIDLHLKEKGLNNYLDLIRDAKKALVIPVIASVNCVTSKNWPAFAKKIDEAGADALELNIAISPFDSRSSEQIENEHFEIIHLVRKEISIPLSVKISPYFTNPVNFVERLSHSGILGIVLFNRLYHPDFSIDTFEATGANKYSSPGDFSNTLRWVALLSNKVKCGLAASTGIHSASTAIKMLLAGSATVQMVSAIYQNGPSYIPDVLADIEEWMDSKNFSSIDQFRGKMSQEKLKNPAAFERVQFMKYISGI